MPVWGERYKRALGPLGEKVLHQRIDALVKYVESLQRTEGCPFRGLVLNVNSLTGQVDMPSPPGVSPFFDPISPMYSPGGKQVAFFQRGPSLNQ